MKVRLHLNTSAGAALDRKLPAARLVGAALSLAAAPCVLAVMTDLWLLQLPARTQTSTEQLRLSSDSTGLRSQAVGRVQSDWRRRDVLRWEATCGRKPPMGLRELEFRPANTDDERRKGDSEQEFSFQGKKLCWRHFPPDVKLLSAPPLSPQLKHLYLLLQQSGNVFSSAE